MTPNTPLPQASAPPSLRALIALIATLSLSALISLIALEASASPTPSSYALTHPKAEGAVRVHFIDIGQGDSALIEGPTGKRVLIDSGPSQSGDALLAYLKALKVERIDMMINTHPHADHIGNASRLLRALKVGLVLDSGFIHPISAYRDMIEAIEETKVPLKIARKGRKIELGGGATLQILGPEEPLISGSRSDANSNSVVFLLTYREARALFTGDAEEETEARLLRSPELLSAGLLKVAHHGSRHASSDQFLRAVSPSAAVISCSERNRYGHPDPETTSRMQRHNVKLWVTAQHGTVVADSTGGRWRVNGEELSAKAPSTQAQADEPHTAQAQAQAQAQAPAHAPAQAQASTSSATALVNINTASESALKGLPGIGPALSKRIIEARKTQPFTSASDLSRVKGIGPKTVAKLSALISF